MKILLILLLLLTGCQKETKIPEETKITNETKELNIEYGNQTTLYDIIKDETITSPNIQIKRDELGTQIIEYKTNEKIVTLNLNIVDTTKPILQLQKTYYVEINKNFDLKSKLFFGDNYDRTPTLEIIGTYDTTKLGTYPLKVKVTDSNGNITEKETQIIVQNKQQTSNNTQYYNFKTFKQDYKDNILGIDISVWQGNIDFQKVKEAGAEFVMIRIGYGNDSKNNIVMDSKFQNNIKNAKEAGLKVGIYFYSYAKTQTEAINQAKWIIEELNGQSLDLPIAFDWESWTYFDDYKLNFLDINNIAKAFMDECIKNGYESILYSSLNYLTYVWDLKDYKVWLAHYTKNTSYENYIIWQNSCTGTINGISGAVDFDIIKR